MYWRRSTRILQVGDRLDARAAHEQHRRRLEHLRGRDDRAVVGDLAGRRDGDDERAVRLHERLQSAVDGLVVGRERIPEQQGDGLPGGELVLDLHGGASPTRRSSWRSRSRCGWTRGCRGPRRRACRQRWTGRRSRRGGGARRGRGAAHGGGRRGGGGGGGDRGACGGGRGAGVVLQRGLRGLRGATAPCALSIARARPPTPGESSSRAPCELGAGVVAAGAGAARRARAALRMRAQGEEPQRTGEDDDAEGDLDWARDLGHRSPSRQRARPALSAA